MKNTETVPASISLSELTSRLISSYQPLAEKQKSFFINDVPTGLSVTADREVLSSLPGTLFYVVTRSGKDSSIPVLASRYEDRTVITITDHYLFSSYSLFYEFQRLQLLARELGGFPGNQNS